MSDRKCTVQLTVQQLKQYVRLEDEIAKYFELIGQGRYRRTREHDSLVIDTEMQRFYWNSLQITGDVVDWCMYQRNWSFWQTIQYLGGLAGIEEAEEIALSPRTLTPREPATPLPLMPPPEAWRYRAQEVVEQATLHLWQYEYRNRKAYLHQRGFSDETIQKARLGWNPADLFDPPRRWGLKGKKIWISQGWTIPWIIEGQLWRLRVRQGHCRQPYFSKYIGPRVYPHGHRQADHEPLYLLEAIRKSKPALLTESELDALSVWQEARDLVSCAATGSVGGSRRPRWIKELASASVVLIAFDQDQAGELAAQYWLAHLPNAISLPPLAKDINQMLTQRINLRAWIQSGL